MKDYLTLLNEYKNSIEIKKSEFITHIIPIRSEGDVDLALCEIKKEHYKANHNCYAYIIGENSNVKKSSDDGEPAGTAGRPILSVLENNNLTYILAVVTRYFGGIKLGASGLTRAYSQAVSECLQTASIYKKTLCYETSFKSDYPFYGKLEAFLQQNAIHIKEKFFKENVELIVLIPCALYDDLQQSITELSCGRCIGNILGEEYLNILEE